MLGHLGVVAGADCFCKGFPITIHETLSRLRESHAWFSSQNQTLDFFVSHKPPTSYPQFPYKGLANIHNRPRFVIGRSMSEEDPINPDW